MMGFVINCLCFVVLSAGYVLSMDCEYSSREYQVVLRPEILTASFKNGMTQILDELTKIERAQVIDFKVSASSLKFKNVSVCEYIPADSRDSADFNIPLRFKSRKKKANEPADIVMKTSNVDPKLTCWKLDIAEGYVDLVTTKFELDVYAENGKIIAKTAKSFTIDLPAKFEQGSLINLSKYLSNAAGKLTRSGFPLNIVPDLIGRVTMQTAEFDIRLMGTKFEATVFLLQRAGGLQSEFSFKIDNDNFDWQTLLAAQQLIAIISQVASIALWAPQ